MILALLLSDLLVGIGTLGLVTQLMRVWSASELTGMLIVGVISGLSLWVALRWLLGLYPGYGIDPARELKLQTYSSAMAMAGVLLVAVTSGVGERSLLLLPLLTLGLVLAAPMTRSMTRWALVRGGMWGKPVVILGGGETAAQLVRRMLRDRDLGFRPVAFFSDVELPNSPPEAPDEVPYLGNLESAPKFTSESGINTVVLALGKMEHGALTALTDWAATKFERAIFCAAVAELSSSTTVTHDLAGTLGIEVKHNLLDRRARTVKRAIDLFGVILGGVLISPLLLALVLLVKLDSPGPVLFGQTRIGTDGRKFRCWKFRTMRQDAEEALARILEGDLILSREWELNHKLRTDPRITRAGRFLRKTSLDELPQLWNVLRGEMSLVGPRPIVDAEIPKYMESYDLYLRVRPGITGLWQVGGRSSASYSDRVTLDTYYVRNWSVWLDLVTLRRTVASVLLRRGAY